MKDTQRYAQNSALNFDIQNFIVYYDVGCYNIGFVRGIPIWRLIGGKLLLTTLHCKGLVEAESIKLC